MSRYPAAGLRGGGSVGLADRPFQSVQMSSLMSDNDVLEVTLSGDGRYLAYVKGNPGTYSLWVRQIATGSDMNILAPQHLPIPRDTLAT